MTPFLELKRISKSYPGVLANDAVDLSVEAGEIHALVGENGAGKSTLMRILYGLEHADRGEILLEGSPVHIPNPNTAISLGIGMVHQHFQLIPPLTVAENVALGLEPTHHGFIERSALIERVDQLSRQFGLEVDPTQRVQDLSVGIRQRVEILKLLYREARLLILDEPSAVLTPQEVESLFEVIQRLAAEGRTTVFITHKLREVMAICQRATILRRGRVVDVLHVAETSPAEIARLMVGNDVEPIRRQGESQPAARELHLDSLSALDDRGLPALSDASLSVFGGEIVGLAGVAGNGQQELLEVLIGLRKLVAGEIWLGETHCTELPGRQRRELGLAIIPEDRKLEGLSDALNIWENLVSTRYYRPPHSHHGYLHIGRIQNDAADLMNQFDVRASGPNIQLGTLSGGNAQKAVIARELASQPRALIAAQPTRGLDVGAARYVHEQLLALRAAGLAILLISADLDELLSLSDRFLTLFEGRIVGELSAAEASRTKLGLLMAGQDLEEAALAGREKEMAIPE
ncbi:MAG: ABC transporter ATP-binding protein [Chloroflexi bacterium]|nr:ABC transporter ATP-binding protein [Chloroflexota bacterium]